MALIAVPAVPMKAVLESGHFALNWTSIPVNKIIFFGWNNLCGGVTLQLALWVVVLAKLLVVVWLRYYYCNKILFKIII